MNDDLRNLPGLLILVGWFFGVMFLLVHAVAWLWDWLA